jgi:hypothetical protein
MTQQTFRAISLLTLLVLLVVCLVKAASGNIFFAVLGACLLVMLLFSICMCLLPGYYLSRVDRARVHIATDSEAQSVYIVHASPSPSATIEDGTVLATVLAVAQPVAAVATSEEQPPKQNLHL